MNQMRNEQGFTLIESLCAVVITSLTILTASGLWQASVAAERQSDLHFTVSRLAVSVMERISAQESLTQQEKTDEVEVQGVTVSQQTVIVQESDLYRVTLTYTWQERGRTHEQTWATIHR